MDRIVGETSGVVTVGLPAGDAVGPLRDEISQAMDQLPFLPTVRQAGAQRIDQAQTAIGGLEQQRAPVGTGVLLVELGDNGLAE